MAILDVEDLVLVRGLADLEHRDRRRRHALAQAQGEAHRLRLGQCQGRRGDQGLEEREIATSQCSAEFDQQGRGIPGDLDGPVSREGLVQGGLDRGRARAKRDVAGQPGLAVDREGELVAALSRRGNTDPLLLRHQIAGQRDALVDETGAAGLGAAQMETEAGGRNRLALQRATKTDQEADALARQGRILGDDDVA